MGEQAITGYAISWNQPAIIAGAFEERFARGAFDSHLQEDPDVAALWAHDVSRPLARVGNGTLKPFRQCRALLLDHSERRISARAGSDCNRWDRHR